MPVGNGSDAVKQTNEIKFAPRLLDELPIKGKDITSDALHTQKEFAHYLVEERKAHYYFCVKGNQPTLLSDIDYYFAQDSRPADHEDSVSIAHGRIEVRRIWTTTALNDYLTFPHVAQVYKIERQSTDKKSGATSIDIAYGIKARKPALKPSCTRFVATGVLRYAITPLTGFMMKTVQPSARGMGLKI